MKESIEYTLVEQFVQDQLIHHPKADPKVLYFIADFLYHGGIDKVETIWNQFHNGYCYYFAIMLKEAFSRGTVCLCAPFGHFVWKDDDEQVYDIEGVSTTEAECFIPVEMIGDALKDFLHIRGVSNNTSKEQIQKLIDLYKDLCDE